ncbi:myb domain-containing protein [Reticulomyxa filosa]|uniref:Myb domain-containing protein n=1 Tax=Reticulomyxa filosa TaxID=46433 RepID=X6LRI6_RETFI|nr:myb domain-containing protein [Reticulomyxa filosa]|eukprot:ETO04244.1 myb domain-containing protein [Reticulomyxa filosa]
MSSRTTATTTTTKANESNNDDVFGLFGFEDTSTKNATKAKSGTSNGNGNGNGNSSGGNGILQSNAETSKTTNGHVKGRTFDDFDMDFATSKIKTKEDTKRTVDNAKVNVVVNQQKNSCLICHSNIDLFIYIYIYKQMNK